MKQKTLPEVAKELGISKKELRAILIACRAELDVNVIGSNKSVKYPDRSIETNRKWFRINITIFYDWYSDNWATFDNDGGDFIRRSFFYPFFTNFPLGERCFYI